MRRTGGEGPPDPDFVWTPTGRAATRRYAFAVGCVFLGWAVREALTPALGLTALPFVTFFPAVAAAAWYGGLGPALLSLGLSALVSNFFFLEGSVRHEGNRIRVAVDLIDASTDAHVWTSRYDRDLTDVFAVQEEIARQVADSLVRTVGGGSTLGPVARSASPEAYAAYLAGKAMLYRRTREGFRSAETQFERAIAEDSSYAPAYAGVATVYTLWAYYSYPGLDFYEAASESLNLLDRAVELDSLSAEVRAARGRVLTRSWAPASTVESDFKRALELQPNLADGHQWYALFLAREGRHAEGLPEIERAVSLDPLAPGVRVAASNLMLAGRRHGAPARKRTGRLCWSRGWCGRESSRVWPI